METFRQKGFFYVIVKHLYFFKSEGDILTKVQITQLNAGIHYKTKMGTDFKTL